jgi:hypothetical protein
MSFAPTFDLQDGQVSPQERVQALMLKLLKRRKSMSPHPADGFLTTGTSADSAAEGDGDSTTTAPGATPGQQ